MQHYQAPQTVHVFQGILQKDDNSENCMKINMKAILTVMNTT